MDDKIMHYGVKGQRWGVITKRGKAAIAKLRPNNTKKTTSPDDPPKAKNKNRISAEISSVKRQMSWTKKSRARDKLSDAELKQVLERVKNENNLRRLAKRKEYLKRDQLSDVELSKRVERLQLEDNLKRNVDVATKTQREIGQLIVSTSFKVAVSMYDKKKGKTSTPAGDLVKKEVETYINGKNKTAGFLLKIAADSAKGIKEASKEGEA